MRRLVEKEAKKDLNIKTIDQKENFEKFLNFNLKILEKLK